MIMLVLALALGAAVIVAAAAFVRFAAWNEVSGDMFHSTGTMLSREDDVVFSEYGGKKSTQDD